MWLRTTELTGTNGTTGTIETTGTFETTGYKIKEAKCKW